MSVPAWLLRAVEGAVAAEAPSLSQRGMRAGLALAEAGYGIAVRLRSAAFAAGVLKSHRLPCRVVCVGNLTTGGTGKTPTVIRLAESLSAAGGRPCILLRGYGRAGCDPAVVSDGRSVGLGWREAGDEAVLLARRLPGVPVVVGADRVAAGRLALARFSPDTLLLDDGFQHRRLARDVDLVLLDGTDPFGGGRLLPRGRLREPVAGLGRAQAVLVTRADQVADRNALRRWIVAAGATCPIGWAIHRPTRLWDLRTGATNAPAGLQGRLAFAVSGIANPAGFHRTLEALGASLVGRLAYPDHHPFGAADRQAIGEAARAAGAECVVVTEKDAVRLEADLPVGLPTLALGVSLEVVEGDDLLAAALGIPLRRAIHG